MNSTHAATYVCVARHGETDWNVSGILQGWLDVPLNDKGRRQAYEMVAGFTHSRFANVCSSPLIRSRETAEIIARSLRLTPPEFHDGLKERNFGAIQGIPKAELAELNPVLLQQILKRNPATFFEQGESMDEFADRVLGAIIDIARSNSGKRILAITHGWTMDVITRHIAGLPRNAMLSMKRKNGECVWLDVRGKSIRPL
jgi:probable phosphoglycerate mutase